MDCPLILYYAGTLGTADYLAPCDNCRMCAYTTCKYKECGFLIQPMSLSSTTTNTVQLLGKSCGGSIPLVSASNGALVTVADLTAGTIYRVYPSTVNGILRGIVSSL